MALKTPDPRDPDKFVKMVTSKKDPKSKSHFGQTVVGHCTFPDCNDGKSGEHWETRPEAMYRKEEAYNQVFEHVRLTHLNHPEIVSSRGRHSGEIESFKATERERISFDIEAPNGRMIEVTYGAKQTYSSPNDLFYTRYRSTDVSSYVVGSPDDEPGNNFNRYSIHAQLKAIEAEWLEKKKVVKARKDTADNPLDAILCHPMTGDERTLFEEVKVRGIDQRNGNALIIRADGTKESVSHRGVRNHFGYTQHTLLLRELDPNDRVDIRLEWKKYREATDAAPNEHQAGTSIRKIVGPQPLTIRFDVDTLERVTTWEGREYRAVTEEELIKTLTEEVVDREGYKYQIAGNKKGRRIEPWDRDKSSMARLFKTSSEAQKVIDLLATQEKVEQAYLEFIQEYSLDLSDLGSNEPEEPEEDVQVPSVSAPEGSGDWSDDDIYEDEEPE